MPRVFINFLFHDLETVALIESDTVLVFFINSQGQALTHLFGFVHQLTANALSLSSWNHKNGRKGLFAEGNKPFDGSPMLNHIARIFHESGALICKASELQM